MGEFRAILLEDDPARVRWFRKEFDSPAKFAVESTVRLVHVETVDAAHKEMDLPRTKADPCLLLLDHDLGGQVYVNPRRKDCGSEFARRIADQQYFIDLRTPIVIHSHNDEIYGSMIKILEDGGFENVHVMPFGTFRAEELFRFIRKFLRHEDA